VSIVVTDRLVGEGEVVGCDLAGYVEPFVLCCANHVEGSRGGDVLHVKVWAQTFGALDLSE
jgi:hypothetical protein